MSVPQPHRSHTLDAYDPYAEYDLQPGDYINNDSPYPSRSRSMRNIATASGTHPTRATPPAAPKTGAAPPSSSSSSSGQQGNTMAEPPSYDAVVGSAGAGRKPIGHQHNESADSSAAIDYSAYTDYIEEYADTEPTPNTSQFSTPAQRQRPLSDPAAAAELEDQFGNLSMTPQNFGPGAGVPGHGPYPSPYATGGAGGHNPRQRSVTDGFNPNPTYNPTASVYSLDSGTHAMYGPPPTGMPRPYGGALGGAPGGPPPSWNPNFVPPPSQGTPAAPPGGPNPYYNAANDFLGLPPGTQTPYPPPGAGLPQGAPPPHGPTRQQSMGNLGRTNTTRSNLSVSSVSSVPPPRKMSESVGASSTRRRGGAVAIDVSKPPYTREFVDDYRNRMKVDPDPEAQFSYAKYLIEAAKKIGDEMSARDPRAGRKYRDNLLAESLRNIKKLAESKDPYADAQFFLANLYGTGQLGLQVDHEKAYYLYLMASKLSHPAATYRAAVCCELGAGTKRDATRAVLFYRKSAALGDTAAMYKLALVLLNGLMGHPRNAREAYVWLRRAAANADEDNPHALHELALLHERQNNGTQGVIPFDPHAAREYLSQAAQLGYAPAQFKLGQCHEFGTLGFPIDPRRSIAWYTRAAERGDSEAELALSGWYLTGSEGVLKQSDTEAYLWGRKAANKGLAKAEYAVGYYTEIGIGVKQDLDLAKRWYQRAAMQGNKRAMQRLQELNNSKLAGKGARPTRKDAETECVIM